MIPTTIAQPAETAAPERISAIAMGLVVIGFASWVLTTLPIQAVFILTLSGVLAWLAWIRTTYAYPVRSRRVIAAYLCAVGFQLIHMSEEYVGGFPHEIVELFNSPRDWSERSFLLTGCRSDQRRLALCLPSSQGRLFSRSLHCGRASGPQRAADRLSDSGVAPRTCVD